MSSDDGYTAAHSYLERIGKEQKDIYSEDMTNSRMCACKRQCKYCVNSCDNYDSDSNSDSNTDSNTRFFGKNITLETVEEFVYANQELLIVLTILICYLIFVFCRPKREKQVSFSNKNYSYEYKLDDDENVHRRINYPDSSEKSIPSTYSDDVNDMLSMMM